jgi:hypothetical protein
MLQITLAPRLIYVKQVKIDKNINDILLNYTKINPINPIMIPNKLQIFSAEDLAGAIVTAVVGTLVIVVLGTLVAGAFVGNAVVTVGFSTFPTQNSSYLTTTYWFKSAAQLGSEVRVKVLPESVTLAHNPLVSGEAASHWVGPVGFDFNAA